MTYTCLNPRRVTDSGANWVKYSDGTGECWGKASKTLATAADTCNFTVALPMTFDIDNTAAIISGGISGRIRAHAGYTNIRTVAGSQELDVYVVSDTNSTMFWLYYHVIGKLA